MSTYAKPVRLLVKEMADELLVTNEDTIRFVDAAAWFDANYPGIPINTLKSQLYNCQTNANGRTIGNSADWDILYAVAPRTWRRYNPLTDPPPVSYRNDRVLEAEDDAEAESQSADSVFAHEHHLRDYLARNMHIIEPGLSLVGMEADAGGGRRIDLLATDKDGGYVVVELKVSRAYDRVVGQTLRYMGWVEQNLAKGKPVRGVIVASEITEDLRLANRYASGIRLVSYSMAVELHEDAGPVSARETR